MKRFIIKILITAVSAIIVASILPGVNIKNSITAIFLALVLALLNGIVKPILVVFTIPVTILTLGLFLLIINMVIIKWASYIVPGFTVASWWAALWFSLLLSFITYLFERLIDNAGRNGRVENGE